MSGENPYGLPPEEARPPTPPPPPPVPAVPPAYSPRPQFFYLNLGSIMGTTFKVWWRNIIPFFLMTLIVYTPVLIMAAQFYSERRTQRARSTFMIVDFVAEMLLSMIITAAVTYAVVEHLRGVRVSMGRCLRTGFSRIFPVLGVSLVVGLCVLVGLALLIFPAFIVMIMFYVAVPVAVVERPGVMNSLRRSAELTKGYRWTIFGIYLLFAIMIGMGAAVLMVPAMLAMGVLQDPSVAEGAAWYFFQQGIGLILTPLAAIVPAVIYHDLRVGKEGVDVKELAEVFD